MKVDVTTPDGLGPGERAEWSLIQQRGGDLASPFLSVEFAAACARIRPRTRVAVFTDGGGVTGFFPFEAGRAGVGRALGQGFSDVQGLVAPAEAAPDARAMLAACGLRTWTFDHLLAVQRPLLSGVQHTWVADRSPVVDLRGGWAPYEQFLRTSSSSLLSTTARRRRGLERDHGPVTLTFDEPDHALLDQVLAWKSEQYRRTGRRDVFAQPGMRHLVHDLLDLRGGEVSAPLAVLRAGGQVVAAHLGLSSPTVLAWWFPVYVSRFSRYSPGLVLCLEVLRAMSDRGIGMLDLGKGEESYKQRLSNAEIPLLAGAVSRSALGVRMVAARRWPQTAVASLAREHPRARDWARGARLRAAAARVRWAPDPVSRPARQV